MDELLELYETMGISPAVYADFISASLNSE